MPEIQYLRTTISTEQREQYAQLVNDTIAQIESARFHPHNGIRFPNNGCTACPFIGLCLCRPELVSITLLRTPGRELDWIDQLDCFKDPPLLPKLDPQRTRFVIEKIDDILHWENAIENTRDSKFVELGKYLCEVRAGQYCRTENLKSFDDFLERRFPDSRRKAYYLMSIHEHLPKPVKKELPNIGWAKAVELVKVARSDRDRFDAGAWLRKAHAMAKEEFQHEVEKHLTGKDTKPSDVIYVKLYKTQLPVIEGAIETAALMLGSDRSRGYCLEMICADFLAGAHASSGDPEVLLNALWRTFQMLSDHQQLEFIRRLQVENEQAKRQLVAS